MNFDCVRLSSFSGSTGRMMVAVALGALVFSGTAGAESPGKTKTFVLTNFNDLYGEPTAESCPDGPSLSAGEEYFIRMKEQLTEAQREAGKVDVGFKFGKQASTGPKGEDLCTIPTAVPDPGMRVVQGKKFAYGMNLDGKTNSSRRPPANTCSHEDFIGPNGEAGIDNQFYRAVGCFSGVQKGTLDAFGAGLVKGKSQPENYYLRNGTSILVEVTGIDDEQNDDDVDVGIYSSSNQPLIEPSGINVLPYATFKIDENPRWQNHVRGKIKNGTLTTDVFDLRLHQKWSSVDSDYYIRGARLRAQLLQNGNLEGMLGGYEDLEALWKIMKQRTWVVTYIGYTCPGLYNAFQRLADGYPDPKTGKCTAISSARAIEGVPAFIERATAAAVPGARVAASDVAIPAKP